MQLGQRPDRCDRVIDWITFVAPLQHVSGERGPFYAGEVMATRPDPTHPDGFCLDWTVWKRKALVGSHSSVIQIQSTVDEHGCPAIWVSGNPAKWFQGHNIFGTDDLHGLVLEMLEVICKSAGLCPSQDDRSAWLQGRIRLSRVDVTYSFDLGTLPRARNAIQALDRTSRLKFRGRGCYRGDSLIFGRGSRRSSLTLYCKGAEIEVKGHQLPLLLQESHLPRTAAGLLRAEVRLLGLELKDRSLEYAHRWGDNAASELHRAFMAQLQIAEAFMLDAPSLEGLPGRLQLAYQAWKAGQDLRSTLSRPTFYRYRTELLKHGIDIGVRQEYRDAEASNVVPLPVVLHARPFETPEWAIGTPLYFEPRPRFG